jgi:hypothetical protein
VIGYQPKAGTNPIRYHILYCTFPSKRLLRRSSSPLPTPNPNTLAQSAASTAISMLTPGKTPNIEKLPPELLFNILELADEPSVHVNVCWVFNQIATPILYRRPHLYYNIHPLLRTIISRPTLGNFVRSLFESSEDSETLDYPIPPSFMVAAKSLRSLTGSAKSHKEWVHRGHLISPAVLSSKTPRD